MQKGPNTACPLKLSLLALSRHVPMQLIFLFDFSLVTLEEDDSIAVKVRGPANNEKECFFFLEEILGCVDQVRVSKLFH